MTELDKLSDIARLQKNFESSNDNSLGSIQKRNGEYTKSIEESAKVLIEHSFPGCVAFNQNNHITTDTSTNMEYQLEIDDLITIDTIKWAISELSPYKSPGGDGIFPALVQKADNKLYEHLRNIITASIKLNYIPLAWRETYVTFLPKPNKEDYTNCKSF